MKKMRIVLLILSLILIPGCASKPKDGGTLKLFEGRLRYVLSGINISDGKDYEVTLSVIDFDESMYAFRLGGKLYCKTKEGDTMLLAGRVEAVPSVLTGPGDYKFTFTAGDPHQTAGETCASPANAPEGSVQFFQFEVQTGAWRPAGDYYRISGSITAREKNPPAGTLTKTADIVTTGGDFSDHNTGMGSIISEHFDAVKSASAGSILRFNITCPAVFPIDSSSGPRPGWAIGSIGNKNQIQPGNINPNQIFYIPAAAPKGNNSEFTIDIPAADCLYYRTSTNDGWLFVNIWHNCKITSCELWEYR